MVHCESAILLDTARRGAVVKHCLCRSQLIDTLQTYIEHETAPIYQATDLGRSHSNQLFQLYQNRRHWIKQKRCEWCIAEGNIAEASPRKCGQQQDEFQGDG